VQVLYGSYTLIDTNGANIMLILKCKMCGGDIQAAEGATYGTCDSCGTTSTLPKASDERIVHIFNRANHLRQQCEFDKALFNYETVLSEDGSNAEAHWGAVLCRYGIEYVQDPRTNEHVPTCHRVQYTSILSDENYLSALENAPDSYSRELYEAAAKKISEIQKDILAISQQEEPYDVFICYKEADGGSRTKDSALAQEIYYQLEKEGCKVFFSRITLEGKLGQQYEPYIFAALNSAKVMLVIGTKKEFFDAVWVKNEWSRFLTIMKEDRSRLIIPCYRDMDAYDLPNELSIYQSQDMSKIAFVEDLKHGIKKVLNKIAAKPPTMPTPTVTAAGITPVAPGVESLLKRGHLFLEDSDWNQANEYFDKVLDINPEYAPAYIGKLCATLKIKIESDLIYHNELLDNNPNYQKALRFADDNYRAKVIGYNEAIKQWIAEEKQRVEKEKREEQLRIAEEKRKEQYNDLVDRKSRAQPKVKYRVIAEYRHLAEEFRAMSGYKDSAELAGECEMLIEQIEEKERIEVEQARIERKRHAEQKRIETEQRQIEAEQERIENEHRRNQRERNANIVGWSIFAVIAVTAIILLLNTVIIPRVKYSKAITLYNDGQYKEAVKIFGSLGNYSDSAERYREILLKAAADIADIPLVATGQNDYGQCYVSDWRDIIAISAGASSTIGLKKDGTVVAVGRNDKGQCDVSDWHDIIAISTGGMHTVGLKADGTVIAVGYNEDGRCDVSDWRGIIAISAGDSSTVGLKTDRIAIAAGYNYYGQCDVSDWRDIIAISTGGKHTIGLKEDGTVIAVGYNEDGRCDVSNWHDIVAISAGNYHTIGLRADGTVVATGNNGRGQCDVSNWHDIIAISAGGTHTIGLKTDGTVIATEANNSGQFDVSNWHDIIAISSGYFHTVALKAD